MNITSEILEHNLDYQNDQVNSQESSLDSPLMNLVNQVSIQTNPITTRRRRRVYDMSRNVVVEPPTPPRRRRIYDISRNEVIEPATPPRRRQIFDISRNIIVEPSAPPRRRRVYDISRNIIEPATPSRRRQTLNIGNIYDIDYDINNEDTVLNNVFSLRNINNLLNLNNLINTNNLYDNFEDVKVTLKQKELQPSLLQYNHLNQEQKNIQNKCSICQEEYNNEDNIRKLKCDHIFHINCIDVWLLEYNYKCPICRNECGEYEAKIDIEN